MTHPARRRRSRLALLLVLSAGACAPAATGVSAPAVVAPPTESPGGVAGGLSEAGLRGRLAAFAHDSMLGRAAGTPGNYRATEYLAREAARLGLRPAGENGTFFQAVPLERIVVDSASVLSVRGAPLRVGSDFLPVTPTGHGLPFGQRVEADALPVVYGGRLGETLLAPEQAAGKLVVFAAPAGGAPTGFQFWQHLNPLRYPAAAAVAIATLDLTPEPVRDALSEPRMQMVGQGPTGAPPVLLVTAAAAARLLGASPDRLRPGAVGPTVRARAGSRAVATEAPARNVVAMLPGRDPGLRGQMVALGAHSDHVGTLPAVDHDSVWAHNRVVRRTGAEAEDRAPTPAERARIQALRDSLAAIRPSPRDSVFNGADDDASGSIGLLAIAEALASSPPRRSVLFVWHTAEELGLWGSEHFTDHPTVPRDSIVAQLNLDMIGRGGAKDLAEGGPAYLQLVGSRRLSTELGDLVEAVNTRGGYGFRFDYGNDQPGHPAQIYCRSDHASYARFGIPVTFFTTGLHPDYHQVTDEVDEIDFDRYRRVAGLVLDVTRAVADLDHRVRVDQPVPDPAQPCRQ